MKNKSNDNSNEIINLCLQMSITHKKIIKLFPDGNEHILKHLAASTIHIALFMNDYGSIILGEKIADIGEKEQEFLKACGCKDLLK
jgi:predicted nucleotidyltransferase